MAFDPDSFVAQNAPVTPAQAFDPEAFVAEHLGSTNDTPPADNPDPITSGDYSSFDPDEFVKGVNAKQARDYIAQHAEGKISLPEKAIPDLVNIAKDGQSAWQRAKNWVWNTGKTVINPAAMAPLAAGVAGEAASGAKKYYQQTLVVPYKAAYDASGDGVGAAAKAFTGVVGQNLRDAVGGLAKGSLGLVSSAAGALNEAGDLASEPFGHDTTKDDASTYQTEHDLNVWLKGVANSAQSNLESPVAKVSELAPGFIAPGGVEAKLAPVTAKVAEGVVSGATKAAGGALRAGAQTAKTVGPAAVAGAELASGHPYAALASMMAGYSPRGIWGLGALKHWVIDNGVGAVDDLGKALWDTPANKPILQHVQDGVLQEAQRTQEQINVLKVKALAKNPDSLDLIGEVGKDGKPLFDPEDLSATEKKIASKQEKLNDLNAKAKKLDNWVNINKVVSDGAKTGIQSTLNLGVAGTTGAAFMSSTQAPGDTEASKQGVGMGVLMGSLGLAHANKSGTLKLASDALAKSGHNALAETHPDYAVHNETRDALAPEDQKHVDKLAGFLKPTGGNVVVVPDGHASLFGSDGMPPTEGTTAPNGRFDDATNTLYLNADRLQSGVGYHEGTHAIDKALDFNSQKFSQDMLARSQSDPAAKAAFEKFKQNYVERARASVPDYKEPSPEQLNSEASAELGRMIFTKMPPEMFYGGKSGGKILGEWINRATQFARKSSGDTAIKTVPGFDAPYTPADEAAIKDQFYKIGEAAKSGDTVTPMVQSVDQVLGGVKGPEGKSKQTGGAPAKPVQANVEAVKAVQSMGVDAKTAKERVAAAQQDLGPDAKLEEVVARALQRSVPEPMEKKGVSAAHIPDDKAADIHRAIEKGDIKGPEDLLKFMPSPHPDAIKEAVVRFEDGSVKTGPWHSAIYEGNKKHTDGYVTNSGEFLDRDKGFERAKKFKQIPKHLSDEEGFRSSEENRNPELLAEDLEHNQLFMPSPGKSIVSPAIRTEDGMIFKGRNWPEARTAARTQLGKSNEDLQGHTEGFVLKNGSFINSEDALDLGRETKQLKNAKLDYPLHPEEFYRDRQFMPSLDPNIDVVIRDYTKKAGIDYVPHSEYRPINEEYSKSIADQYGRQKHEPENPEVARAYDSFRDGILGQYQTLLDHGYKIEPWPKEGQPYANSAEMLKDLRENKHLYYFKTEKGYGEKGGSTGIQHPQLRGSGIFFNGEEAPINDIFRGVHDALGHGAMGYQFGPRGEYNAFLAHKSTLPPVSHEALATETLGQNSWTNFGPHMRNEKGELIKPGEPGYLPITERPYTEQRANLLKFMPSDRIQSHEVKGTNSRPVSQEEFDSIRDLGKRKLEDLKKNASPTTGLDEHWNDIKDRAWSEAQKPWGGVMFDSHTGEPKVGAIGDGAKTGEGPFGLTAKEDRQKTIEVPEGATREEFDAAMDRAKKAFPQLKYKDYHLGIFHDNSRGTIDIDPTVVVHSAHDAEAVGAHTRAIGGAYDFSSGNGLYPPHVSPDNGKVETFMPSDHPSAIAKTAIRRDSDGKVFTGSNPRTPHWMIPNENEESSMANTLGEHGKWTDGYLDNSENFLNKEEGHARALEVGQIPKDFKTEYKGALSSLDLKKAEGLSKAEIPSGAVGSGIRDALAEIMKRNAPESGFNGAGSSYGNSGTGEPREYGGSSNGPTSSFMPSDHPEAIDKPAVRFPDGKVYTGFMHGAAWAKGTEKYSAEQLGKWVKEHGDNYAESGYVQNNGNFVDSKKALDLAQEHGQVTKEAIQQARNAWGLKEDQAANKSIDHLESMDFTSARKDLGSAKLMPHTPEGFRDYTPEEASDIRAGARITDAAKWDNMNPEQRRLANPGWNPDKRFYEQLQNKMVPRKGGQQFMPVSREVPKRFYADEHGFVYDRLTGKDVDVYSPDNEQGDESPQELADSWNRDNYPLPTDWTGSHPDAWIPEWGTGKHPDKEAWGISGEPQPGASYRDPKTRKLHGEYPTQEAAETARQQMLNDLYAPQKPNQLALEDRTPKFMPGPIGEGRKKVDAEGKIIADTDEQFWTKAWPKLMKDTGLTLSSKNEKNINKAAAAAVEDVHSFLTENPRFSDYYNKDWEESKKALDKHYGKDLSDDEMTFFKLAKGLTSPNTALGINVQDAINVTGQWLKDGNLDSIKMGVSPKGNRVLAESPVSISGTTNSIKAFTLKAVDKLSQELGGPKKVADYLMESVPVSELQEFNKSLGYKGTVGKLGSIKELVQQATGQSENIPRMFIFGRKVGAYTLNLLGEHRYQTIDAWESRFIRSQFKDMSTGIDALPKDKDEHTLFTRFSQLFNEEFNKQTGLNLDNSALQAARWFYMLDSARKAGYTGSTTAETISHYVNENIRNSGKKSRGLSDAKTASGNGTQTKDKGLQDVSLPPGSLASIDAGDPF